MKLKLQRYLFTDDYTMGLLFIDGIYFCDTIEDKYRGQDLKKTKVMNETCIPYGVYTVKITYSPKYKKNMPQILDVPYFTGVRIHSGNYAGYKEFYKMVDIDKTKEILDIDECIEVIDD